MRVPTANVIVGFNREAIDRLFTAGATYTDLIQELSKPGPGFDDTLLFDSVSNPNFLSFEHSNNMGEGIIMKLTLIDPKGEFEKRFTSDNIVTTLAGYAYNGGDSPDFLEDQVKKDMKKSGSQYDEAFFADLAIEYEKHKSQSQMYIAYGTGDNLDLWSGPHRVVLNTADLSMKGARKISLTFAPSPTALQMHQRRGAYNEKVNLDLAGLTMRYSGISKDIKFQNILDLDSAYDPWNYVKTQPLPIDASSKSRSKQIISTFSRAGLSDLADLIQDFDYHSLIVDTLRSYIQKATSNPNVIVLLPNINIICRNLINNTALETIPRFSEDDGTYPVPFNRMWSPTEKLQYKENFIKAFLEKLGLGFLFVHKALYVFGTDPKALPVGDITFKKDLEESTIGMSITGFGLP